MTIEHARVVRQGTAIEILASGGRSWVVRAVDLMDLMPDESMPAAGVTGSGRRLAHARASDDSVLITYTDGLEEYVPARALRRPIDRADHGALSADAVAHLDADLVVHDIGLLMTAADPAGPADSASSAGSAGSANPLGLVRDAAVVMGNGHVLWLGPSHALGQCGFALHRARRIDAAGRLVTPGLLDCHSHPLFAGNRADEFGMRAEGRGYLEIAAAGGGIKATLEPTRACSISEHIALTATRMSRALCGGTTMSEAKSGYDLSVEGELRLLHIAQAVDGLHPIDLCPTLLGAHVVPPEYTDDREAYVRLVIEQMIPRAADAGLAAAVDVYCDQGAFTLDETRRILTAGQHAGLGVRAHVGQFADLGGAELVAELGGWSVDHLENVSDAGIAALARADVVAVMLPGACVQLRMTPPPVAKLRAAGVPMAVATDLNPGTSLCETLPVQMWLATTHYGMTVTETWLGVTRHAARAMGLGRHAGVLTPGALADAVIWNAEVPAEIPYRYGADLVAQVIKAGRVIERGAIGAEPR